MKKIVKAIEAALSVLQADYANNIECWCAEEKSERYSEEWTHPDGSAVWAEPEAADDLNRYFWAIKDLRSALTEIHRKPVHRKCEVCSSQISENARIDQIYCSAKCKHKAYDRKRAAEKKAA